MSKKNLYFISLNMNKDKHKDLIKWLKDLAKEQDRSLSYLCIKLLESCKNMELDDGNSDTDE